jgi:DNA-binding IclR family transcriptional regulator
MTRRSPPTERVIQVLNLLGGEDQGLSASVIARRLHMTTSTCATLLAALDSADYVERAADKTYRLGPGLLPLVQAMQARFPLLGAAHEELRRLSADLSCGATLTRIAADHLRVVAAVGVDGGLPPGVALGSRFPVSPPYGSIAVAWRPEAEIDRWLTTGPTAVTGAELQHARQVMADIRLHGVGVWSLEAHVAPLIERIGGIIADLSNDPTSRQLRAQLTDLFAAFGQHGYTADDRSTRETLAVGYVLAAVFGADRQPRYQIELQFLRPDMPAQDLDDAVHRVLTAARELTRVVGGQRPSTLRSAGRSSSSSTRSSRALLH